ncbi:MAG: SIS domain-containing protein [bacterium]|nr:SIS domain-containing protein [bacterium]
MEKQRALEHLKTSASVHSAVAEECIDDILKASALIANSFQNGGKLLLCGNGGSAADCQHMAAEFVSRLTKEFERPGLPAIALTTDTSFLTAFANDINFEGIFARQVQALGKPGDILLGISTSGNSANVIAAIEEANKNNINSIGLCGASGKIKSMATVTISVPDNNTQYIQECHLSIEHIICDLVERKLFVKSKQ